MFELRCPNCGYVVQLSDDAQAEAVTAAAKLGASHHVEACPRCQWVMRVPVISLQAALPAAEPPVLLTTPAPPMLLEAEKSAPEPKPARRAPAKKTIAKKPAAKKPATKKSTAKKPATKKPTAKKSAAKQPAAKKPTAKKPAVKKPAAKKK